MTSKILVGMQRDNLDIQSRLVEAEMETLFGHCVGAVLRISLMDSIQSILLGQSSEPTPSELKALNDTMEPISIIYTRLYGANLTSLANFSVESTNITDTVPYSMFPLEADTQNATVMISATGMVMTDPVGVDTYNNTTDFYTSITLPVVLSSEVTLVMQTPQDLVEQRSAPIIGFITGVARASDWEISPLNPNVSAALGRVTSERGTILALMPLTSKDAKNSFPFELNSPFSVQPEDWDVLNTEAGAPVTETSNGALRAYVALEDYLEPYIVILHSSRANVGESRRSLGISLFIAACISCVVGFIILFTFNRWRTRNLVNVIKSTEKRKRALDESRKRVDEDKDLVTNPSSTLSFNDSYLKKDGGDLKNSSFWPWKWKRNSVGNSHGTGLASSACTDLAAVPTQDLEAQPRSKDSQALPRHSLHYRFKSVHVNDEAADMAKRIDSIFDALILQYKVLEDRVEERQVQIADAKRAADEANAAKSHFLARVTHELRTPLNGILGTASLCMDEDDIPQIRSSLKTIYKCGELLLHLLTDLLSFSQSESERVELDEQEMMIEEVTAQISAIFREQTETANIDLHMNISPECSRVIVFGDLNRILQVVFNLLSNSIKFTPNGGRIDFNVNAQKIEGGAKRLVTCIVRDNGPGIAPHLQKKVFEAFVQGDINNKVRKAGVGLGLSICKQLAQRMGGTITLKSELGKGAEFTLKIPLRYVGIQSPTESQASANNENIWPEYENYNTSTVMRKAEAELGVSRKLSGTNSSGVPNPSGAAPSFERNNSTDNATLMERADSSSSSERGSMRPPLDRGLSMKGSTVDPNLRVLVADDNKVNQEVMIRMLNLEGLKNIVVADDGLEAVEKTKDALESGQLFDIIFMDVQMPNCDGKKATQTLRSMGIDIPIVAVSAYANDDNVEACLAAGMNLFLAKPLRRPSLHKLLEGLQEAGIPEGLEQVPEMPEIPKI